MTRPLEDSSCSRGCGRTTSLWHGPPMRPDRVRVCAQCDAADRQTQTNATAPARRPAKTAETGDLFE